VPDAVSALQINVAGNEASACAIWLAPSFLSWALRAAIFPKSPARLLPIPHQHAQDTILSFMPLLSLVVI
jgi:hypothetical protein